MRRADYYVLRNACLLSGAIGLVIFALFPVAPPRLADVGMIDKVTRYTRGYRTVLPPRLVNDYAAMPSFHAGWNVILGVVVFRATRQPLLRTVAVGGPLAMIASVILTANHFVLDVVAGTAISLLALAVVRRTGRDGGGLARAVFRRREVDRGPELSQGRAPVHRRSSREERPRTAPARRGSGSARQ
ncbi:MAG: phosphatase PAP2 family protein [Solirubrobacteraceae bacterium]